MSDGIDLEAVVEVASEELRQRVESSPWLTLAGAAGVGYVLGAGIPNFVLKAGSAYALRLIANRLMSDVVQRNSARPATDVVVEEPSANAGR